jgi:diguanylate cyclase (GGDEF)-like protein
MAPTVRTNYEVVRWIAIQTLFASCFVVPATFLAIVWMCGGDFSRQIGAGASLGYGLALAVIETLIFTPIVAIRSVATLKRLNLAHDELDRLANTDPLTGLFNRRGFEKAVECRASSRGAPRRPVAMFLCDVDFFKQINDEFGHEFGDAALRQVAEVLRSAAARRDVVLGRYGGDEFMVLLIGVTRVGALEFAETVRQGCASRPVQYNGSTAAITLSTGFATALNFEAGIAELVARADVALYEAKREGRNRVVAATETLPLAA